MNEKIRKIQVLGAGCPSCKKMFELTKQAALELGLKIEVEYITDITVLVKMGVMSAPALAINDKLVFAGALPNSQRIKELIQNYALKQEVEKPKGDCSCHGC